MQTLSVLVSSVALDVNAQSQENILILKYLKDHFSLLLPTVHVFFFFFTTIFTDLL